MDKLPGEIGQELAPLGRIRAAINFGNPVLAQRGGTDGEPVGITVTLARELARRMPRPIRGSG